MEDKFFNTTIYNEESRQKAQNLVDDYMEYQEGMEILDSTLLEQVQALRGEYKPENFTEADVRRALSNSKRSLKDFGALLSSAALPLLEELAIAAQKERRKYFKVVGLEIYPVNSDEYVYLHKCGADYVTVFQETYNSEKYGQLHLAGHKRCFPYRFYAQERALRGGMRGVGLAALLGLDDFRKDAFATGLHAYLLQRQHQSGTLCISSSRRKMHAGA